MTGCKLLCVFLTPARGQMLLVNAVKVVPELVHGEVSTGWNVDLLLPPEADSRAALTDLLQLLRTLPVPRDTYVVHDAEEEHYVYEDGNAD